MTILVVDDDPSILRFVKLVLTRVGYDVVTAPNAEEGLAICRKLKQALDLVISDVSMPGMSGAEFAKCIAAEPNPVPIVLMSGYSVRVLEMQGLNKSQLDSIRFLPKPFLPKRLTDLVETIIGSLTDTVP